METEREHAVPEHPDETAPSDEVLIPRGLLAVACVTSYFSSVAHNVQEEFEVLLPLYVGDARQCKVDVTVETGRAQMRHFHVAAHFTVTQSDKELAETKEALEEFFGELKQHHRRATFTDAYLLEPNSTASPLTLLRTVVRERIGGLSTVTS